LGPRGFPDVGPKGVLGEGARMGPVSTVGLLRDRHIRSISMHSHCGPGNRRQRPIRSRLVPPPLSLRLQRLRPRYPPPSQKHPCFRGVLGEGHSRFPIGGGAFLVASRAMAAFSCCWTSGSRPRRRVRTRLPPPPAEAARLPTAWAILPATPTSPGRRPPLESPATRLPVPTRRL
jgi:hypothetical protein